MEVDLPADTFVHVLCDDALPAAGVVLRVPQTIVIGTSHGNVQQLVTWSRTISLQELHVMKGNVASILSEVGDPRSLSKEAREDFNQDCLILVVAMHIVDPDKYPLTLARQPQQDGCAACGRTASQLCSKCRLTKYCGRECQKAHWRAHKPDCVWQNTAHTDPKEPQQ